MDPKKWKNWIRSQIVAVIAFSEAFVLHRFNNTRMHSKERNIERLVAVITNIKLTTESIIGVGCSEIWAFVTLWTQLWARLTMPKLPLPIFLGYNLKRQPRSHPAHCVATKKSMSSAVVSEVILEADLLSLWPVAESEFYYSFSASLRCCFIGYELSERMS